MRSLGKSRESEKGERVTLTEVWEEEEGQGGVGELGVGRPLEDKEG